MIKSNLKKNNKSHNVGTKNKNSENENKRKISFELIEVILIMTIMTFLGLFLGCFITYRKYNDKDNSSDKNDIKEISKVYNEILEDYYGEVDKNQLIASAVNGMLLSLDDSYASYLDKVNSNLYDEQLNGGFVGFGIEFIQNYEEYPIITKIYPSSPAEKNGIQLGDIILEIDHYDMKGTDTTSITNDVKSSEKGEIHQIKISRNDEVYEFNIELDNISIISVSYNIFNINDKNIAVITISNFAKNTYLQFLNVLNILNDENISSIIIDLRNNTGGYLSSATSVASLFLNKDSIIYQRKNKDKNEVIKNEKDKMIDLPIGFLVNQYTASASEMLVSSLKENLGSIVIGKNTFGKGTIQKVFSLDDIGYYKFTTQLWLTSKGKDINGIGIMPDVVVENNSDIDEQLNVALERMGEIHE